MSYVNIVEKLYLMTSREGTRSSSGRKLLLPLCLPVSKEKKKKTKKRWTDEHRKLYIAADVHTSPKYHDFYWSIYKLSVSINVAHAYYRNKGP